jgi:multidrug transporter EmrE-like cation transporter
MLYYYSLLILGSLLEFTGDSTLKFFARTDKLVYGLVGVSSYVLMTGVLVVLLKMSNVMYTNVLWEGLGLIIESGLAFFLLQERMSNMYQYFGLGLVITGMGLLNIGKIPK